jgi:glycosyltransferase involved in cell wall biosynthesis
MVSAVILTYNHEHYIEQALESALEQRVSFPYEIVVGEDESSDATREICRRIATAHPDRIRLIERSRADVIHINGHATGRHNFMASLRAARGKYIAVLEGDDYWTNPGKLQRQVDVLEANPSLIACHHWHQLFIEEPELPGEGYLEDPPRTPAQGYSPGPVAGAEELFENTLRLKLRTLMFRNVVDDDFFPPWFREVAWGDMPLAFLLGRLGQFHFIDEAMAVYRVTGRGVSTSGLNELHPGDYHERRLQSLIEIWDHADRAYEYRHHDAASRAVARFYAEIVDHRPGLRAIPRLLAESLRHRSIDRRHRFGSSVSVLRALAGAGTSKAASRVAREIDKRREG